MKINLGVVTIVLAILKLTNTIHISWFWVFVPALVGYGMVFFGLAVMFLAATLTNGRIVVTRKDK